VSRVPRLPLRLRALVREDYLVACRAAWLEDLGVVSAAVDVWVLPEVDEVHQQLLTRLTHEALRVPALGVTRPHSEHRQLPAPD